MKLSKETIQVLQNFATIQKNLVISEGNTLKTMAEARNILASVEVPDVFPSEMCFYDLDELLSAYALVENPSLDFQEGYVRIHNSSVSVKYYYANKSILTYPQKDIKFPQADFEITIPAEVIAGIRKAATALGYDTLSINTAEQGAASINVLDVSNSTANSYTQTLANAVYAEGLTCEIHFLVSNLKLLPGNYKVSVSEKLISKWENLDNSAVYFIAMEKTSSFKK